jgi:hypothetical protein
MYSCQSRKVTADERLVAKENTMLYASRRVASEQGKIPELGPSQNVNLCPLANPPQNDGSFGDLAILSPLVLTTDLLFLLGGEVVGDIESLADLLWRLALDHVGNRLATNVKEGLDVEVIGGLVGNLLAMIQA